MEEAEVVEDIVNSCEYGKKDNTIGSSLSLFAED